MATATLERGSTSVEVPLLADSSGTPLVVRSIGKPNLEIQETGNILPRHVDQWSGLEQYSLAGRLFDYQKAITLYDLIKSNSNGEPLYLSIDMPDYDDSIMVAPAAGQAGALSITYPPGKKDNLTVDLSLTRVSETIGGGDQPAETPTENGNGPIQIAYRGTTIDLIPGIEVTRSVGRSQSVVRKSPSSKYPIYIDKFKTADDSFELSFEFTEDTVSKTNELVDLFSRQLKRSSLELRFNGRFGLGTFDVVPDGSEALRHNRQSGYKSSGLVPSVNLRRVLGTQ